MRAEDQKAILAIALHAAFADGAKDDREREEIRRIADSLASASPAIDLRALYQDVLLKRFDLGQAVSALSDEGLRHYAYEMALGVCEADGRTTAAERRFLGTRLVTRFADGTATSTVTTSGTGSDNAALDQSILNHALLNGALELLPQSWASMAIIPLQIKMVYGIGQAHGVALSISNSSGASCSVACSARWPERRRAKSVAPPPAWRFPSRRPTPRVISPSATTPAGGR